jgi:murein L,D-transpeptidase YcbB/YkuD
MTNPSDFMKYIPAAWRVYQHLDEIRSLQERASPHIDALLGMSDEARQLLGEVLPEDFSPAPDGKFTFSVSQLQEALNKFANAKLKVDGKYGERTKSAVENYQRTHGLTADGWAGVETLGHIFQSMAAEHKA